MTANERYEKAWNSYLVLLNRDSKSRLTPFLREQYINIRGMQKPVARQMDTKQIKIAAQLEYAPLFYCGKG